MPAVVTDDDPVWGKAAPNVTPFPRPAEIAPAVHDGLNRIIEPWTEDLIPPRPWVAPGYLLRGSVTALAGPASAGKSSLVVGWTVAHALGEAFGRFRSATREPLRSGFYAVEDDADEQRRRYSAMCRGLATSPQEILPHLVLCGPNNVGTLVDFGLAGNVLVNTRAMDQLDQLIGDERLDSLHLDPFVELHGAEENDNTAIRGVLAFFRSLARRHNIALNILFHTRKGDGKRGGPEPGDPDAIRGASSIVGAVRIALMLSIMTAAEAAELGIPAASRRDYVRLDDAKKNYSRIEDVEWFERVEHDLDNGDRVAALRPWSPVVAVAAPEETLALIEIIARGSSCGPWSPRLSDDARSIKHALVQIGIKKMIAQKAAIKGLLNSGAVKVAFFQKAGKAASDAYQGLRTAAGEPDNIAWLDAIKE